MVGDRVEYHTHYIMCLYDEVGSVPAPFYWFASHRTIMILYRQSSRRNAIKFRTDLAKRPCAAGQRKNVRGDLRFAKRRKWRGSSAYNDSDASLYYYKTIRHRLVSRSIGRETRARTRDDMNTTRRALYFGVIFPTGRYVHNRVEYYNTRRGTAIGRGDAFPRQLLQLQIIPALS